MSSPKGDSSPIISSPTLGSASSLGHAVFRRWDNTQFAIIFTLGFQHISEGGKTNTVQELPHLNQHPEGVRWPTQKGTSHPFSTQFKLRSASSLGHVVSWSRENTHCARTSTLGLASRVSQMSSPKGDSSPIISSPTLGSASSLGHAVFPRWDNTQFAIISTLGFQHISEGGKTHTVQELPHLDQHPERVRWPTQRGTAHPL
jgi:hypothetical protein